MRLDFTDNIKQVTELDKKAQYLDETLKDLRIKIHDILWGLLELKNQTRKQKR